MQLEMFNNPNVVNLLAYEEYKIEDEMIPVRRGNARNIPDS